ncbi:hypothetical protein BBJ28_00015149 [Nothophytophthora sp. Chile5]|nr:hypothetical protein BBJ28_00015149 [Nothophytophthora sp. Chile5]
MTETTDTSKDSADDGVVASATTVRAVEGFFAPKSAAAAADASTPLPLFKGFELVPSSWAEFQHNLTQLEKEEGSDGAARRLKVVYFLRHAEGIHNEAHTIYGSPRWEDEFARTEAFLDSALTPFGIKDAQDKGQASMKAELERGMPPIERVVVSPLSRTIETAQNFFAKDQVPDEPFVCIESCREILDCHTCNKRRPMSEMRRKFPSVDFSAVTDEEDLLWSSTHRETTEEIQTRARAFLLELFDAIPERYVVVAGHMTFIEAVCAVAAGTQVRLGNCEMVPMVLEAI